MSRKEWLTFLLYLAAVFAMPLLGVGATGRRIEPFLALPPRTQFIQPAPFSWQAFCLVAFTVVMSVAPFLRKIATTPRVPRCATPSRQPFPASGWVGLALLIVTWIVAWNRFPWATSFQRLTFTPLWVGYIGVVNALTVVRAGSCPLTSETRLLIALFPLSAIFWWSFEYLNRFVGNWYYPDVQTLSASQYILEATLPFSTVLPAVYSTAAWLATYPGLARGLDRFIPGRVAVSPALGFVTLILAALLLASTAIWPAFLFPLIWVAPLLLMAGLQQVLLGNSTLRRALVSGDFRRVWTFALAGLTCGLLWELWNFRSLAHWEYQIPYVGRFHLFAMPLLGYSGYLPFGILCALFIDCLRSAFDRNEKTLSVGRGKRLL